jgi:solute carrier family 10 (sodium/bile acid cotransporter), member 7
MTQRRTVERAIQHPLRRRADGLVLSTAAATSSLEERDSSSSLLSRNVLAFLNRHFFVIGMMVTIAFSYQFPNLGRTGSPLHPERFIQQYAVMAIFFLSGLSLQFQQIQRAVANVRLNLLIQIILFLVWPWAVGRPLHTLGLRWLYPSFNILSPPLWDGLFMATCLPTTVNMCVILTATAGGDVAAALCNAVLSNLLGILGTPLLLLHFFGSHIHLSWPTLLGQLSRKVLLPLGVGQILRAALPPVKDWYQRHNPFFKRAQEVILLSILWNAFSTAMASHLGVGLRDGMALLVLLPLLHLSALASTGALFALPWWKFPRAQVVAAMFCSSQKTLAFGLPLLQTMFHGNANVALYCAPLMLLHPIQLTIGSLLVPKLEEYVKEK